MTSLSVRRWPFAVASALLTTALLGQTRIASDFELQQMQKQIERSKDFVSQVSGRLNLGDVRVARSERALAREEYRKALDLTTKERLAARGAGQLTRYATATSYAALAAAKLGDAARAFQLSEEALRYDSGSAKTWNLYASAMTILGKPRKSVSAARNAVNIAARGDDRLDFAVYRYTLASALIESSQSEEAERLLSDIVRTLHSSEFASLRERVARRESFEIYSTARGEEAAYISLLNRSQLRLGALYEARGAKETARQQYEKVLEGRSDDPTALAAMARLARSDEERERFYADAFDANPFSLALIREYRPSGPRPEGDSTGARMRRLLGAIERGELQSARVQLDALAKEFPDNDTLRELRRRIDERGSGSIDFLRTKSAPTAAELRALIGRFDRLEPEDRAALDTSEFTSTAIFDSPMPFEKGTVEGVPFKFSEPLIFSGDFAANVPLRMTYRILGASGDVLLLEPVRLEVK
jgi:hypothetical protein